MDAESKLPSHDSCADIELFADAGGLALLTSVKLTLCALLLAVFALSVVKGSGSAASAVLSGLAAVATGGLGAYDLFRATDTRAQMRICAAGFTAIPYGPALVPWGAVQSVEYLAPAGSAEMVRFHLDPEAELQMNFNPLALGGRFQLTANGARFVQVEVSALRDGKARLLQGVRRFAPDIAQKNCD